jgi:glycosyltransferase involved in cell wall biosynthesis
LRILFVTCHLPWPPVSGGRRREWELLRRLEGVDVDLVAVSKTPEEDRRNTARMAEVCRTVTVVPVEPGAPDHLAAQVRRHHAPAARRRLAALTEGADLVHLEAFYLAHLLPPTVARPVVLTDQNVEFDLWDQRAAITADPQERRRLQAEADRTWAAEVAAWEAADRCVAVTEEDAARMREVVPGLPVTVVPDGVVERLADPMGGSPDGPPTVTFVANFAYEPNLDAARHLLDDIAPRVDARVGGVCWQLVGNDPPPDLLDRAARRQNVLITGRVPYVAPYLDGADVVLCPLRVGGGVKVKVLEALAHGCAVVTTPVGAQGLGSATSGLVVAEGPEDLAARTSRLLLDPAARATARAAARAAAAAQPTWDDAARQLVAVYDGVAGARRLTRDVRRVPA